ncbi:MAG TPA: AsnC family transcriptional regulator, partial [Homoserinimonas sp.]|nr:AsnC family transcriptional regulator [Homoserinimonas sp.]
MAQSKKLERGTDAGSARGGAGQLDAIDRALLRALASNARASGAALAATAGVAESCVSLRLKRLHSAGYLRGYRADIDV